MHYEWDPVKNRTNQRKHGISFEAATAVFRDENCVIVPDRVDQRTGEPRWHAIGLITHTGPLLLVAHVYRENIHGEEIIRIISARKAGKKDRSRYSRLR